MGPEPLLVPPEAEPAPEIPPPSPLDGFAVGRLLQRSGLDAFDHRERSRLRRLGLIAGVLSVAFVYLLLRAIGPDPVRLGWPRLKLSDTQQQVLIPMAPIALLCLVVIVPMMAAGRSPHQTFQPEETGVRLADVVGAAATVGEAVDTLNLFLAHKTFTSRMGGQARRGVLFEGPPGTGKTYLAKAIANEAGVPFLFVPASAFQSMYFGQTNRKIRSFFRSLRHTARREGGAIGFIDEFDAIGMARRSGAGGLGSEGYAGVVNELLVQMQSFETRTTGSRLRSWAASIGNLFLPAHRRLAPGASEPANVLLIGATNRASELDPALLRPGRFDRIVHFGMPAVKDRRAIAEFYLRRKAHEPAVDSAQIAELTVGYSPAQIERLLDEALICALRGSRTAMSWADVLEAKLINELGQPGEPLIHSDERWRIAVHEAGHALVAELVGRRVTLASILRRADALGLVAHDDGREVQVHTPSDARAVIHVALAGMVAEELVFGEASSGVAADLAAATKLVSTLVGAIGAGGSRLSLDAADMPGAGNLVAKVLGDETSRTAAEMMLVEAEQRTRSVVEGNLELLHQLALALVATDELTGDEVRAIVHADDEN